MSDEREYPVLFSSNVQAQEVFQKWIDYLHIDIRDQIAPKKKRKKKMWLWAYCNDYVGIGLWGITTNYLTEPLPEWLRYKRLDYSEIEVEE